jgi:segregation and condensation protein B
MSLKAKLEAVIYAAEEPVTLAQLAAIFAEEVLSASGEDTGPAEEQMPLAGLSPDGDAPVLEAAEATLADVAAIETPPQEVALPEAPPPPLETLSSEEPPIGPEIVDEKKAARQRERKVRQVLQGVIDELISGYANSDRGMEIREIAGGYRMATKPEYHDAVRSFIKSLKQPMKLSLQALETLAVIAYKQPVTAPEVSEIRGVDSGGVLGSLVSRKLVTTAGRKPVIGRPILYKTTKEFLLRFGLKDVNDLPSMEEFEKMAGELVEAEPESPAQEEAIASPQNMESAEEALVETQAEQAAEAPTVHADEARTEQPTEPNPEAAATEPGAEVVAAPQPELLSEEPVGAVEGPPAQEMAESQVEQATHLAEEHVTVPGEPQSEPEL